MADDVSICPGCGAALTPFDGPTHAYMSSSPACWRAFGDVLAAEYSDASLTPVHRLSVDAYAVQHPGDGSRRAIQSVGLHLARLHVQLEAGLSPEKGDALMRRFAERKTSIAALKAPDAFSVTVADVAPKAATDAHAAAVEAWARAAWEDWRAQHDYIRRWVRNA